jgi:ATP-binding cassette subfamily G (WHITE) protein 2 (SNQ2)
MDKVDVPMSTAALRQEPESAAKEKEVGRARDDSESTTTRSSSSGEQGAQSTRPHDAGVNISRAEADFAALNREFSRTSHLSRTKSRQSRKGAATDVEKGADEETGSEEPFDLETVLRGNRDEEEQAGIKSKRIGVVFEDLTVSGVGGVKSEYHVVTVIQTPCRVPCRARNASYGA